MKINFLLLFILFSINIFAQKNDELHLSSLKEATIFLAKVQEKKTVNIKDIENCESIDGLSKFEPPIDGLKAKIGEWDKISDISKLKEKIISDLTTGKNREERKKKYEKDYNRLIQKLDEYANQSESVDDDVVVGKEDKSTATDETIIPATEKSKPNKLISFLPYILIFLLSVVSFILFNKIKKISVLIKNIENEFKRNIDNKDSNSSIASLSIEVKNITSKLNEIIVDRNNLNNQTKQNVVELSIKPEEIQQTQVETVIRYAKSSTNGGFSSIDLKQKQNNECIFELHITGNKAKLKLSEESKVQQYALSENPDYYFKSDVCTIQGIPASDKKITVNQDGELELNNDKSKWNITKPINITFS